MSWFKKERTPESIAAESKESEEEEQQQEKPAISGNLEVELTKIKSQLEALNEVRKANAEQFTRVSEQVGELRGALMDSNKAISIIEVASTKAIDMVNSVQPDKLMIEVRKVDGKIEALRANIEANESIMKDIMKELKGMRSQMNFYKGVDQIVKLNNEIKQELIDIKKTEGLVGKHADRVETIFVEVEKKFYDFDKFNDVVKELDRAFKRISSDFDKMRVNIEEKADKKEFVKLVDKFSDFEKHTTNILKLLDQKSRNTVTDLNTLFDKLKKQLEKKYDTKITVTGLSDKSITETTDTSATARESAEKKDSDNTSGTASSNDESNSEKSADGKAPVNDKKKGMFGLFKKKTETTENNDTKV
jgi:hypothetical protein